MASKKNYRIGQIVPSSNTTMETEIPRILREYEKHHNETFTFHSSRMRMKSVNKEELAAMDKDSDRCALELSDARVDVMGYACLVAIMSMGIGYHRTSETRLTKIALENESNASVVTSAGALVEALHTIGAKRVAILTPYMKPLTKLVIEYIEAEGIEVVDSISLEISDNLEVGLQDSKAPIHITEKLDTKDVDAVVASACVQMPSLESIQAIEDRVNKPVISAAVATAYMMLKKLNLPTYVPGYGSLLSGNY